MPAGATPLDFAYHVHTELGHRCRGAKVNGRIVPLTYRVQNGQKVEIITGQGARPSRDWLNPRTATSRRRAAARRSGTGFASRTGTRTEARAATCWIGRWCD